MNPLHLKIHADSKKYGCSEPHDATTYQHFQGLLQRPKSEKKNMMPLDFRYRIQMVYWFFNKSKSTNVASFPLRWIWMTHIDKWIHMALLCMDSWIPLEDLEATHHDSSERMTKMFTDWIGLVLIEHHTHQKSIEKPKKSWEKKHRQAPSGPITRKEM